MVKRYKIRTFTKEETILFNRALNCGVLRGPDGKYSGNASPLRMIVEGKTEDLQKLVDQHERRRR